MTRIIAAFPGVGKTHYYLNSNANVLDLDLAPYLWLDGVIRHPDYPDNYVTEIKNNVGKIDLLLVSLYTEVRKQLLVQDIAYELVYPSRELKEEYLERYRSRGNPDSFVTFMLNKWDEMISELEKECIKSKIVLKRGEYLSNIL